jgi:hypothetical protein
VRYTHARAVIKLLTWRTTGATREIRRLLRHCESRFAEWRLPASSTITTVTQEVSRRRGRPIHLIPLALGADQPSGLSLTLATMDVVVYEAETSRTHQEHIIAHELAHIMCGHTGIMSIDENVARLIFPNLDPGLVRDMLNRAGYGDEHELEAEIMASVILRRMNARPERTGPTPPAEVQEVLDRLEKSFSSNGDGS